MSRKKERRAAAEAAQASFSADPFASLQLDGLPPGPEELDEVGSESEAGDWRTRRVILRMERKGRNGKTVTVLSGWDPADLADLPKICKDVRKRMGCGGTVRDDEIELQGDLRRRVAEVLSELGFKPAGNLG